MSNFVSVKNFEFFSNFVLIIIDCSSGGPMQQMLERYKEDRGD